MPQTPDSADDLKYIGNELELFQYAETWKRYLASRLRSAINGDVLEVGAGLGVNIPYLYREELSRWVSLEPDSQLCEKYRLAQSEGRIPDRCELVQGTLETLPAEDRFDSILYIDVLEHIEDDWSEFARAYNRLKPGGHLMVLCPAHNFLFSPFDKAIGHFRRYNKEMYRELSKHQPLKLEYLDSVGMFASIANKSLLKQSYPDKKQILLWDRVFVPVSKILDPLTFRMSGKSILGVWKKD